MFKFLIIYLSILSINLAVQQKITLYDGHSQTGTSVTFTNKFPNLTGTWDTFIANAQSYCVTGWWIIHPLTNYLGGDIFRYGGSTNELCGTFPLPEYNTQRGSEKSLRYLGPSDTNTSSISFYSEEYERGQEVIVERIPQNVPFHPRCMFATGPFMSWTLYEGIDFTGNSVCYTPIPGIELIRVIDYTKFGVNTIRSIVKGCLRN